MTKIPTALEILRRIEDGTMTCEALVRICLQRIAEREPTVQAWQHLEADTLLDAARRIDRSGTGLLKGLPIGVKDIIDTVDMPTSYGSSIYEGFHPARDAACVALARHAGALILGKTVTTEFAYYQPGKTHNPHDHGRTPGGSSSGSAAAVADGMVPLALGSQTAGSVIRPASYCGCVGYKPTLGLIDRTGVRPFADSLDTVGVFARTVEDAALFASVISGRPGLRIEDQSLRPQIGLSRTHEWGMAEPASAAVLEDAFTRLRTAGLNIREVVLPESWRGLSEAQKTIMAYEGARACAPEMLTMPDRLSAKLREFLQIGVAIPHEEYDRAKVLAAEARAEMADVLDNLDVLLTPSAPGEAPQGLQETGDPAFNRVWTLLGAPCVNVPGLTGSSGMPVGIQVIGRVGDDARTLAASAAIAQILSAG
ncbi:amidase [Microvirga makkahensis]|uniref:Amidase n=1 Tax=Microvirga makkahensis TaxID=1128670 RepID=A0A7X3MRV2_9HYPH|nr:amidase [Microvirga makkahensis]MXQ12087.1 amidase [Microvirga makkahensis]